MAKATAAPDTTQTAAETAVPSIPLDVVNALINKIAEIKSSGGGLTPEQLESILAKTGNAQAEALGRQFRPENQVIPLISAFSYPEGETARPKPRLVDRRGNKRTTLFCGVRQEEDALTPAEIEAFNAITDDREARNGTWKATVRRDGPHETLKVDVPCGTPDARMSLPSLTAILFELNAGPKAVDLDALTRQLADLKDQLNRATASQASE